MREENNILLRIQCICLICLSKPSRLAPHVAYSGEIRLAAFHHVADSFDADTAKRVHTARRKPYLGDR